MGPAAFIEQRQQQAAAVSAAVRAWRLHWQ